MELASVIHDLAQKFHSDVVRIRHHLHAHPELSFEEYNTSRFIADLLKEWGVHYKEGFVKTGIIATLTGLQKGAGKTIALRADMDALPIREATPVDYCSKNPGVMHACGHDVHSSALLGAIRILKELAHEYSGTIHFIFQPGEEKAPGGASLMIAEGVLDYMRPSGMIAQHVFPELEAGKVGFRSGQYMASTDEIYLTVKGKGGHAAMRGTYVSPLLIASEILLELEKEFGGLGLKELKESGRAAIPTVLAFGKFQAEGATNVIPDVVKIDGTFRTMDESWRKRSLDRIREIAGRIAESRKGSCEVNITPGYPSLINDENMTSRAKAAAIEYLGKENVVDLDLRMTGEDFSFFAQQVPACFYRLGTANKALGITSGVHTPTFNIDESALKTATGLMAWMAIKELKSAQ